MGHNRKTTYEIACDEAEKLVDFEIGAFKVLSSGRKVMRLGAYIKEYIDARKQITRLVQLEQRRSYGMCRDKRIKFEYVELLNASRIKKFASVMDKEEKHLFIIDMKRRFDEALRETDSKKLMKVYDYLTNACFFANITMPEFGAEISNLKESCEFIINKAYGLDKENEGRDKE